MTEHDLLLNGFINHHCRFTLKSSSVIQGVIITSPEDGHGHYCFLSTDKMKIFKEHERSGDIDKMKTLVQKIDFDNITSCERLEP
jgi:hypothetical protein